MKKWFDTLQDSGKLERKSETEDLPTNIEGLHERADDGRTVAVKFNAVRVASIFNCDKSKAMSVEWTKCTKINEDEEFERTLWEMGEIIYGWWWWNPREREKEIGF